MQLDILIRIVLKTVVNVVVTDGSARAEGHPFAFFRGQGIGMVMEFGNLQRAVQHHVMNGISQIAEAAPQTGNQLVVYDDAPVFIAFFLGSFSHRMPEGQDLIGINHQFIYFFTGQTDVDGLVLLQPQVNALAPFY